MERTARSGDIRDKLAIRCIAKRERNDERRDKGSPQPLRGVLAELERFPELRR